MTPADLRLHADLGIDADLLTRARVRRVSDLEARALLSMNGTSGHFAGIEYPYCDPQTGHAATCRIRLDEPEADGKKYRAPFGDVRHLYFPPGARVLLSDVGVPVLIVEAEKSALALTAAAHRAHRPLLVIALGGCWNWRGRIGKTTNAIGARVDEKGLLGDFHRIAWPGREAVVLFDARPNPSVHAARRELARAMRPWGATLKIAFLPDDDPRVNGPDDLIRFHNDAAVWTVIDRALPEEFTRYTKGSRKDAIVPGHLDNIRIALARLDVSVRYDEFRHEMSMNGAALDDVALERLWIRIDDECHFRPSKDTLRTVLVAEGHAASFHPVRRYLDGLKWDQTPRLDDWLITYGGAAASDYVRAVGALPLIAAVRRVRHPGTKFDELLVVEGAQGTMKSAAMRALCVHDDWFSDDLPLGVDSKVTIERTTGKWLIEAAELYGNRGREAEQLKTFLSRQFDGPTRLAYGRFPVTVPRQFVLIGTTNSRVAYLKDMTGARRFWPVRIRRFDVEAIIRDRDQLWAEAAAREADGASIRLSPDLWPAAGDAQEDRRATDPWEEILEPVLDGDGIVRIEAVAVEAIWEALKLEANYLNNNHADRVAAIVQRHGFTTKKKMRVDGRSINCWVRETDER